MSAHQSIAASPAGAYGGPALRGFFRLAELWGLRITEQRKLLGDPPESTFYKWKRQQEGSLGRDTLERISYLLGIWKDLQILFPDPAQADGWLRRPNAAPLFGGRSALQRMLSGNVADLFVVRQYLDAQRG
ncbi:MbcA/ParS/Xre antitoxin family protein [Fulvimonas sp. R45]|uniref:MbcA/ParS/Xre antitoxin family protein n=1 Tax=Fulvimonas sp. R45 TaxID=3045937 RepID=UPI00265F00D1|nr:MbcA/ParS/Xre antitoxin family protein [Fulvimonas sp. R45]MDO1529379.1 MbcA/ParS/Xre antitoxin family protein [Fulvimonas sp. R45]